MAAVDRENASDYRPPPHVVNLCDQLAVAAAIDFARRLRDVAKETDTATSSSAGLSGSSTTVGTSELFSHVDELANHFARRFTCFLSENFEALARDESEGGAAAAAFGSEDNLHKGSKLRRSFKKKFSRKHKDHAEKKARKRLEKETVLKQLVELDGSSMQWVKCRVMLKREPGGYMINFFSPPKSTKPRSGIFCFLIIEVRQTTNLELPDVEHSFVIKGQNSMEYILECHNNTEMWSWIAAIRECARNDAINRGLKANQGTTTPAAESSDEDTVPPPPPPEDGQENIPPRVSEIIGQAASREGSTHSLPAAGQTISPKTESMARGSTEMLHLDNTLPTEYLNTLANQPWFHGMLSRQEATMLVCQGAAQAHGTFLVRQSESRHGQMVLTFNCHGRAKHLRMTMMPDGTCRVQQWTFDNIFHLIDYFKVHPVPLDTGVDSDVVLTSYVMAATASSAIIQTPPPAVTNPAKPTALPLQRMNSSGGGLGAVSPSGADHSYVNTVFFPVGQPVPVTSPTSVQPPISIHQRTNSVGSTTGTPSRANTTSQPGARPRSRTFADGGEMRPSNAPRQRPQNNYQFT